MAWVVRKATTADLDHVRNWLADEDEQNIDGCFYCNIGIIEQSQPRGDLTVAVPEGTATPVGFLVGSVGNGPTTIDIIEVANTHRGMGAGSALVEEFLSRAKTANALGVVIERTPLSSVPFWNQMGFRDLPGPAEMWQNSGFDYRGDARAILAFDAPLVTDTNDPRWMLDIEVTTEQGRRLSTFRHGTRCGTDRRLHLERRFVLFSPSPDYFIEAFLKGVSVHPRAKLKYSDLDLVREFPFWGLAVTRPIDQNLLDQARGW